MYLYYFERIVRSMSGDSTWALPYWNWQLASERQLPEMFRDKTSSLYTANRNVNINNGTGSLPGWAVDCSTALADLDYASAVEDIQTPHGNVHVQVGGWMSSVPTAAQDPIFYLHHSNVDRLWDIWLAQGGGRADPVFDATWKAQKYTFYDENGKAVTLSDCEVLRAAQQLDYEYEGEPPQVNEYCTVIIPYWLLELIVLYVLPIPPVIIHSLPVVVPISTPNLPQSILATAESTSEKLLLTLNDVVTASQPGVNYQVYFNPVGETGLTPSSPFYLGAFSLFGLGVKDEGPHGSMPATIRLLSNNAVKTALSTGGQVALTIVPSTILIDGKAGEPSAKHSVDIGSISFSKGTLSRREG
jgi:tyrosinase